MDSIYQFNAPLYNSESFSLSELKGKTVLIVNTASKCSFSMQLNALEKLYQEYKDRGFTVLAFPCNQFGQNEPFDNLAIRDFYQMQFGVSFKVFGKVMVNGPDAHPLFSYLKCHTRGISQNRAVKWNFTKFLVDRNGNVLKRYAPSVKPKEIQKDIEELL